ncbi:hypothetical protein AVEN_108382-1 [Araneus ventricosus]|uniref:Uncharacterized protein n=1 Tax=Araneus ventricosus TaxID=182803 RepID=A0A4Y2CX10_ARAVE|nr:hypothetical protein AVEN_108382-1 [Araneus ventricosus]
MVSDKLYGELDCEVKTHIAVKQAEACFKPQVLSRKCGIYLASRSKQKVESVCTRSYSGFGGGRNEVPDVNRHRNYNNKTVSNLVRGIWSVKCAKLKLMLSSR